MISLISLELSGDLAYNLMHWTTSRPSAADSILALAPVGASPLFLMGLILKRSPRKIAWISTMLPLLGLAAPRIQQEYKDRVQRNLAEYQKGLAVLLPETGTLFTRCEVKHLVRGGGAVDEVYVQGHVPKGARVTLLSDPFPSNFGPRYCTGIAGTYRPADSDPAVRGNVIEIESLKGYDQTAIYNLTVIERTITRYTTVPVQPFPSHPELSHPVIQTSFQKCRSNTADLTCPRAGQPRHRRAGRESLRFRSETAPYPAQRIPLDRSRCLAFNRWNACRRFFRIAW